MEPGHSGLLLWSGQKNEVAWSAAGQDDGEQEFPASSAATADLSAAAILPYGQFRRLHLFRLTDVICVGTTEFCRMYVAPHSRTGGEMLNATDRLKHETAEISRDSGRGWSRVVGWIALAQSGLETLLQLYDNFLRLRSLPVWDRESPTARQVLEEQRADPTYRTYRTYLKQSPETAANAMICLLHQASDLLDRQSSELERQFLVRVRFLTCLFRPGQTGWGNTTPEDQPA